MSYVAGKQAFLEILKQEGVSVMFGNPGTTELPPMAGPFVKWAADVRRIEDLPRLVRRATKTALAYPTGPVFLSLPVDVLNAVHDLDLGAATRVAPRIVGDRQAIDRAARLLAK